MATTTINILPAATKAKRARDAKAHPLYATILAAAKQGVRDAMSKSGVARDAGPGVRKATRDAGNQPRNGERFIPRGASVSDRDLQEVRDRTIERQNELRVAGRAGIEAARAKLRNP